MSDPAHFYSPVSPNMYFGLYDESSSQPFGFLHPDTAVLEGGQFSTTYDEDQVSEKGFDVSCFWADPIPSAAPPTEPAAVSLEGSPQADVSRIRYSLDGRYAVTLIDSREFRADQIEFCHSIVKWSVEERVLLLALLKFQNFIDIADGKVVKLETAIRWSVIKPHMDIYMVHQRKPEDLSKVFDLRINRKTLQSACTAVRGRDSNAFKAEVFQRSAPQALKDEFENIYRAIQL